MIIPLVILLIGRLLRFRALFGDFWLDELTSYNLAQLAASPLDIFLMPALRVDNNHLLNTVYIFLLGPGQTVYLYRLLSCFFALATLVLL